MSEPGWGRMYGFKQETRMKTFFVGVTSCMAWCGYGAYSVVAETPEEAEQKVRERFYPDWGEKPGLTVKVVQINTSWGVHELDELDVVG